MSVSNFTSNIFGISGVILIQTYYLLLQINKCKPDDLGFLLANFFGSLFLLISLYFDWNLYAVLIEISWLIISAYGLCKIIYKKIKIIANNNSII